MTRYRPLLMAFVVVALAVGGTSASDSMLGRVRGGPAVSAATAAPQRDGLVSGISPLDLLVGSKRNDREPIGRLLVAIVVVLLGAAVRARRGWAVGGRRSVPFQETSGHALRLRAPPVGISFAMR